MEAFFSLPSKLLLYMYINNVKIIILYLFVYNCITTLKLTGIDVNILLFCISQK